ncbi:MAG: glycosyltransferase family 87 protein, partial [Planctomycetota bacterium]
MKLPRLTEARTWVIWAVLFAVICLLLVVQPGRRSVTPNYAEASARWWAADADLYGGGIHGFLYLPQSAIVYTPFTWPPPVVGDALWRCVGLVLLAFGIRRLADLGGRERRGVRFGLATLLVIPAAWSSLRNGQANLHLSALMIHGCLDLAERRWGRAAFALCLAFAIKPLALVPILLALALVAPVRLRLVIGLVVVGVLPFLHPDPAFAWRQLELAFDKLARSRDAADMAYTDVMGFLTRLGIVVPAGVRTAVQAAAAVAALGLTAWGIRRSGLAQGCLVLLGAAACYLMLFNPRTETNSYVILVPLVAGFAVWAAVAENRRAEGVALALCCLALASDNYGRGFHALTRLWLKPVVTMVFAAYLVWRIRNAPRRSLVRAWRPVAGPVA